MNAPSSAGFMPSPLWPTFKRILIASIQERRNGRYLWVTWAMFIVAWVAGIAAAFLLPARAGTELRVRISVGTTGFLLIALGLLWWSLILQSVLSQYSSFEASLVPALARRIRASTALFGFALSVTIALAALAIGMNVWLSWAVALVLLSLIAWLFVQPMWMIGIVWITSLLFVFDAPRNSDVARMILVHDPLAVSVFVSVCIAFAVATYRAAFSESPERREKMQKRMAVIKKMYAMDGTAQTAWGNYAWNGWAMKAPWSYTSRLRAMLVQNAAADRLAPMVFGPTLHWSMVFNMTLAYAVLTLVGRLVLSQFIRGGPAAASGFFSTSIIFAFLLPIIFAAAVRPAFWQSRSEQALLVLTPRMPQGQALNRLVARFLLTRMALAYLGGFALLLVGDQFSLMFPGHRDAVFLAMLAIPAPMIPMMLLQAARMRKPGPLAIFGMIIMAYATCGVVAADELVFHFLPTGGIDAIIVILSLLATVVRYRSMVNGPCQFPAGRLDTRSL